MGLTVANAPIALDEYPIHQTPLPMSRVAASDRNFYDRCYFNAHDRSGGIFLVTGLGVYPNLGVIDAYAAARLGDQVYSVRFSDALAERSCEQRVGGYTIEVTEPLRRLHLTCASPDRSLDFDLHWTGSFPVVAEEPHLLLSGDRPIVESSRFCQLGTWQGRLRAGGREFEVSEESWSGARDRSWGIRPVGESEPAGIQSRNPGTFYWLYAPVQFDDHAILCIVQEDHAGRRVLEEAVRVWPDGTTEDLGRPSYTPAYREGTRDVVSARIGFSPPDGKPFDLDVTPLLPVHLMVGTGYGLEPDWKHGMYQGPDLVVQGVGYDLSRPEDAARMWGMVDAVGRFEYDGHTGYGLYEYWALGDHPSFR